MTEDFEAYINPKDLQEYHIVMDHLNPEKVLKPMWGPFLRQIIAEAKPYPPPPAGSTYERTFHLEESWEHQIVNPLRAEVGNVALYAGWVQGVEQAGIHQGRWTKLVDVTLELFDEFVGKLSRKVGKIWTK